MIPNKRPLRLQPATSSGPDYSNTLNKRLAFLWTDGVSRTERVTGAVASVKNAPAINTRSGRGLNCSTGQANIEWPRQFVKTSDGAGGGDFTLLALAAPTVGGGAVQHIFAQKNDPGGAPFAQASILANSNELAAYSSGSLAFFTYATNDSGVEFAGGIDGNFHVFVARRTGTNHQLWIDGKRVATVSKAVRSILQTPARYTAVGSRGNGTSESMAGAAVLAAGWDRALSGSEIAALGKPQDLWRLFEPRRIWVPVSAGGAPVLITATPGNAAAAGVQARVNQARQVTGTAGNAVANGVAARVNQARTIVGTAGNATAAGLSARIDQARRITGSAGNAVADGEAASIYLGRLITATPGDAAAAGVAATIFNGAVIQATPGNAVAAGRPATILGDQIIVGNAGNATAAGVSAQVGQNRRITGNTANATAEGLLASIYAGVTVRSTPAVAAADGVDATVLQAITISATAGDAVAAGRTARIIEGDAPIYAAIPASRKARGRFGERPAQLSTGRRR